MSEAETTKNKSEPVIYEFAGFYLNTFERKLIKNDEIIKTTTKSFDILKLLVENAGELVTKERILNEVWGDRFVEEGNLTVYISKLRKLMGVTKTEPLIETVSGEGYRFVCKTSISESDSLKHGSDSRKGTARTTEKRYAFLDSVAIMPFKNDNQVEALDYLAAAITEDLINGLSSHGELKVIAKEGVHFFEGRNVRLSEIGEKLRVNKIVTGRVRQWDDDVEVAIEMIEVPSERQLLGTKIRKPFKQIFEIEERL